MATRAELLHEEQSCMGLWCSELATVLLSRGAILTYNRMYSSFAAAAAAPGSLGKFRPSRIVL